MFFGQHKGKIFYWVTPLNFLHMIASPKIRVFGLPFSKNCMIVGLFLFKFSHNVMDGQSGPFLQLCLEELTCSKNCWYLVNGTM